MLVIRNSFPIGAEIEQDRMTFRCDMTDEEEAKERQENELQVLQSIFMDDIRDVRKKDAWKVWRPLEVEIYLKPQQSMSDHVEVHAHCHLCIKCSQDYPDRAPQIDLKQTKGLSKGHVDELKKQLIVLANQLKGEVMILELSQYVQRFLHSHNKPQFESFYEEMLDNQKRQEEELAKEERKKEEAYRREQERQQQAIQEEIRRKQEALKEEGRRRRSHGKRVSETNEEENANSGIAGMDSSSTAHRADLALQTCRRCSGSLEPDLPKFLSFRTSSSEERSIQLIRCIGHSCRGRSVYLAVDLSSSGDLFAVAEWSLRLSPQLGKKKVPPDDAYVIKQVNSLEQEFSSLQKIWHTNLVHYLGINHEKIKDKIVVQLVQEYVCGTTLANFLNQSIPLDVALLRHYTRSIVDVLRFLHDNSIIHRDIRASSIFIENSGTLRLSDYSLDKRVNDLVCSSSPQTNGYPLTFGKGGKKGDVYRLGIILLSLSAGKLITDLVPKIPTHLSSSLKDFLQRCLQPNEHERWTFEQLSKHSFVHDLIQNLPSPEKSDSDNKDNRGLESEMEPSLLPLVGSHMSGSSRLQTEFEVLQWLGKGGFGDVLKVRNKLDGRLYAIKKISLNPSRQQLNRKIMREVKLLSRLNHENVVRYYNSWIETTTELIRSGDESSSVSSHVQSSCPTSKSQDPLLREPSDDIEKLAPPTLDGSVEWSVSYEISSHPHAAGEEEDSSDDEEDMDVVFGTSFLSHSLHDSVIFDHSQEEDAKDESKATAGSTSENPELLLKSSQFMYIQMEFCERSTLRIAIDRELYKETDRMWRLFREIIEGLGHIHQQGMIHRDLKPVNIFLDVNDHVKIGDFGLATTDIIPKVVPEGGGATGEAAVEESTDVSRSEGLGDGGMTGAVGTALYLAPELMTSTASKIHYSQKVDLYSLGIIFFEMCYPTPSTGMERVKLLMTLRQKDVALPSDASNHLSPQQVHLIGWLLQHDPSMRPTSEELLSSEWLPPPQLEEAELNEMLRHTVSNPQSKGYKRMMASLFRQRLAPAADFSYDMDIHKASVQQALAFQAATSTLTRIMNKHGALHLAVPTLTPKGSSSLGEGSVHLMDHGGTLVTLPNNLRVSFARFIARRDVTQMKRYAIDKVYRERKVYGCHPRELYECAFDIVTPSQENLLPDAEVLAIVSDIISEFPKLQNRNYYVRLNHYGLLRAIFVQCGISEEKHQDICQLLIEYKLKGVSKFQMQTQLSNFGLSDQAMVTFLQLTEAEDNVQKISSQLKGLTKRKGTASSLAGQSLTELQKIITCAENMGLKAPVLVSPGFVYEPSIYSGMIFQFICEQSKKGRKGRFDVLAAGGRYTQLVSSFRMSPVTVTGGGGHQATSQTPSVVGVSIAMEKITTAIMEEDETPGVLDVAICTVGKSPMWKEKCSLLRTLWAAGVHAHAIYDTAESTEEASEYCRDNHINHLLILHDFEPGFVKVRSFEKERFVEKKVAMNEFVYYVPKLINSKSDQSEGSSQPYRLDQSHSLSNVSEGRDHDPKQNASSLSSAGASCQITFMPMEKMTGSAKRRIEAQIQVQVTSILPTLSSRVCVEVLAVDLNAAIVKMIAAQLELESEGGAFLSSLATITETYPRHRKYITRLAEHIHDLRFEKKCPAIVLYSLSDYTFKVML